jgi:hypothetical protein
MGIQNIKVSVVTVFCVTSMHLARPDLGVHAHMCAPPIWSDHTPTFGNIFSKNYQQFFSNCSKFSGCSKTLIRMDFARTRTLATEHRTCTHLRNSFLAKYTVLSLWSEISECRTKVWAKQFHVQRIRVAFVTNQFSCFSFLFQNCWTRGKLSLLFDLF